MASLRASETDEEYNERDQLLQELSDMIDSIALKKRAFKEEKSKNEDKRESDGQMLRNAAMASMIRSSVDAGHEIVETIETWFSGYIGQHIAFD
ncbi:hypothetical protein H310_15181 [Aphanomyces invadans]|uniref:Uncharacterized protein n=1 Tax=Aphanomyces invadans TaxID=157072 RepID=A0A024T7V0_9STRA|nr:hypothetical protein H310_15181 [Aphanomyces invadans]ETV89983.1 hypothetical protein H310_15181 [Aphanomyces invadans]|eukprot:XP_008881389.1 hypothetical protein H310_15181 [Aphanomyces invadans]